MITVAAQNRTPISNLPSLALLKSIQLTELFPLSINARPLLSRSQAN